MTPRLVSAIVAIGLVAAACAGNGASGGEHGENHMDTDTPEINALGEAGASSEADRTIEVETLDDLAFEPSTVEVEAGETITFVVTNSGGTLHEFVLGDETYQDAHEGEMSQGAMEHGGNSLEVEPGETEELTWIFEESGKTLFGCHVSGHYEGGMVGTVEVGAPS